MKHFTTIMFSMFLCAAASAQNQEWIRTETNLNSDHLGMFFFDSLSGFLSGTDIDDSPDGNAGSKIFQTNNGGETWQEVFHNPTGATQITSMDFISPNMGFAASRWNHVLRTNNGGTVWEEVEFDGIPFIYQEVDMVDAETGYVTGWSGEVYKTEDGGDSWQQVLFLGTPYQVLDCITCTDSKTCLVGGFQDRILKTINGGETWETVHLSMGDFTTVQSIFSIDDSTFVAVGSDLGYSNASILKSVDGGETWGEIDASFLAPNIGLTDVYFRDDVGYAVGAFETIIKSNDLGESWTLVHQDTSSTNNILRQVRLTGPQSGFICGDNNVLFYRNNATGTGNPGKDDEFDLYPNPFVNTFTVSSCRQINTAKLILYNNLGQQVYVQEWDRLEKEEIVLPELLSGAYFYTLQENGQIVTTGKLIKQGL